MDIYAKKRCPKCSNEMLKGNKKSYYSGRRNDGQIDGTDTIKYMCRECGYIEEYAVDPRFWGKLR